jgi:hypothetical protein
LNLVEELFIAATEDPALTKENLVSVFTTKVFSIHISSLFLISPTFQLSEIRNMNPQLFTLRHINSSTAYFAKGFLQNLEAYQYAFAETPFEYTCVEEIMIQTPLRPLPTMSSLEIRAEQEAKTTIETNGAEELR